MLRRVTHDAGHTVSPDLHTKCNQLQVIVRVAAFGQHVATAIGRELPAMDDAWLYLINNSIFRFIMTFKILCTSLIALAAVSVGAKEKLTPVDYVNPLVGTESKGSLSTGNTYPAIAMPWGMNFWMPQTGKMGDGWAYVYWADKIRGFKQTHQPRASDNARLLMPYIEF